MLLTCSHSVSLPIVEVLPLLLKCSQGCGPARSQRSGQHLPLLLTSLDVPSLVSHTYTAIGATYDPGHVCCAASKSHGPAGILLESQRVISHKAWPMSDALEHSDELHGLACCWTLAYSCVWARRLSSFSRPCGLHWCTSTGMRLSSPSDPPVSSPPWYYPCTGVSDRLSSQ